DRGRQRRVRRGALDRAPVRGGGRDERGGAPGRAPQGGDGARGADREGHGGPRRGAHRARRGPRGDQERRARRAHVLPREPGRDPRGPGGDRGGRGGGHTAAHALRPEAHPRARRQGDRRRARAGEPRLRRNRRFNPQFIEGSEEIQEADTVVLAIGQAPDLSWIMPGDNLRVSPRGTLQADPATMATSRPDVFAGGDAAFGPRIIITAVAEGKKAARSIAKFLTGRVHAEPQQARVTVYDTGRYSMKPDYEKLERRKPPALPLDRRVGIAEVENAYPASEAT